MPPTLPWKEQATKWPPKPRMAMTTSNSTNVNACLPKSVKRPIGSTGRVINRNSIAVAIVCPSRHRVKSAVAIQNNIKRNVHIRKFIPTTINKDNTTRQIWEFAKLLFFSCNVEINGMPDSPEYPATLDSQIRKQNRRHRCSVK